MRSTRFLPILLAVVALLALPGEALAWKSDGRPTFRPGTIRYWVGPMPTTQRTRVAVAIRAWNASGARIRLAPSTRTLANIRILRQSGTRCDGGTPSIRWTRTRRLSAVVVWRGCATLHEGARMVAHELGHALGLEHDERTCAVMTSSPGFRCLLGLTIQPWQYYCRILEPDDVRGIVRRYGGTLRYPTTRRLCSRGAAPLGVGGLTVSHDAAADDAIASWTNPSGSTATGVGVLWRQETCPTGPADSLAFGRSELGAPVGAASVTLDAVPGPGTLCVLVQPFDRWGQPGPASTATVSIP